MNQPKKPGLISPTSRKDESALLRSSRFHDLCPFICSKSEELDERSSGVCSTLVLLFRSDWECSSQITLHLSGRSAGGCQLPATAGALRQIQCGLQPRAPARSSGYEMPGGGLPVYQPSLRPYTGFPDIDYPFHDKTIVVTRCGRICLDNKKSISARSLPDKPSASRRFTTTYGWSVLWIMIWDTSIWRLGCSNRSKIRSAQKCHPCDRYVV